MEYVDPFCGHLVYFILYWHVVPRKILQPCYLCAYACIRNDFFSITKRCM
jgi:hypothetical protein